MPIPANPKLYEEVKSMLIQFIQSQVLIKAVS
jgi:hypothetical protein